MLNQGLAEPVFSCHDLYFLIDPLHLFSVLRQRFTEQADHFPPREGQRIFGLFQNPRETFEDVFNALWNI